MSLKDPPKTRLAPSPTGTLHLGHTLHLAWIYAVQQRTGASVSFRMEDHDRTRCLPRFESDILTELSWLGITLDTQNLWRQSERSTRYEEAFNDLQARGLLYACVCSRKDIAASIGLSRGELRYPGTCRDLGIPLATPGSSTRLLMPDQTFAAIDLLKGPLIQNPSDQCGDIVIRDRAGSWTYQFCVVIDDLDQGIDLIIRGEDLLSSVGRQLALRELISSRQPAPSFLHHPLVLGSDGEKLSKKLKSTGISHLRAAGKSPAEVWGTACFLAGFQTEDRPVRYESLGTLLPESVASQIHALIHKGMNP